MAQAARDRSELPLGLWVDVGALMEGVEKLVPLVCVGAKQASLALIQLDLSCLNGSGHAPLLCNHGGNFSVCVMVPLELSCDSPVLLGSGVVVHHGVCGVIGKALKEPVGELSLFFDGDALRGEEFMPINGLINTNGAQAVEPVHFDVWGKDMHSVVTVGDWDEEIKDVAFILLVTLRSSTLLLPFCVPSVCVFLPVLVGGFQVSHTRLMLCQIFSSLLEYFELLLIVMADLLIFACNSCQSLHNEEELLSPGQPMSFESSAH